MIETVRTYREDARIIPIAHEAEVLVVGGGPAGVGAAVAAAREGADTLLVEASGMLGGTWTLGMQTHATCFHDGEKVIVGGLAREIIDRLCARGAAQNPDLRVREQPVRFWLAFDHNMMRIELDEIVAESHARLLLHTMCVGAIVEDGLVRGIVTESKSGRQAIRADVVVDCTGDADVAFAAGAPTVKGRDADGRCQPATMTFMLGNVDYEKALRFQAENKGRLAELEAEARARGELDFPQKVSLGTRTMWPNVTYHNQTRILGIDATRSEDLTRAEIEGRRQVLQAVEFYRRYVPGFESCYLLAMPSQIGLRESRRIVGEYVLTADDVLSARHFPDAVARHHYYIDVHSPDGEGLEGRSHQTLRPPVGTHYEVPYRCLIPREREQILVAGRCISATREALGSSRTTCCCVQLGEAAGLAAAWAVRSRCTVRQVPGRDLSKRLFPESPS